MLTKQKEEVKLKIKKMARIIIALIMVLSMGLVGCSPKEEEDTKVKTETPETPETTGDEKIVIGCTFDYVSDFMAYVADGATAYQTDNPNVEVIILDAKMDVANQLKGVENLIAQNVDAIVIKPVDKDASKPIADLCAAAGIPLIVTNAPLNAEYTSFVGSDNILAGRLEAEYIAEQLGNKGNVAILLGDPNNQASRDRTDGNKEVFGKTEIKIVAEQVGKWMRDEGMRVTENWIQSDMEIDAIVANNDEMATGAALAAKEAGKDILIAGVDATPDALRMLKEGTLAVTVFQNGHQQGYIAVDTAVKAAKGESVEKYIDVPFELVTPDKADEYLAKYNN